MSTSEGIEHGVPTSADDWGPLLTLGLLGLFTILLGLYIAKLLTAVLCSHSVFTLAHDFCSHLHSDRTRTRPGRQLRQDQLFGRLRKSPNG